MIAEEHVGVVTEQEGEAGAKHYFQQKVHIRNIVVDLVADKDLIDVKG